MAGTDNSSLYTEIRVLTELLREFRADTKEELGRIPELQNRVTVISTRCEDKTCAYDKSLEKYGDVRESVSKLNSRLDHLEQDFNELENVVNKVKDAEQKRLSDTLVKAESTLEDTRKGISHAIWKIIPIVVSVGSILVTLYLNT